jgi:hypothetical protein
MGASLSCVQGDVVEQFPGKGKPMESLPLFCDPWVAIREDGRTRRQTHCVNKNGGNPVTEHEMTGTLEAEAPEPGAEHHRLPGVSTDTTATPREIQMASRSPNTYRWSAFALWRCR